MWLNEEILSTMFQEKVKNQRWELEKARKRNAELQKNCKRLEEERKIIDNRLAENQFGIVTEKNNLNSLFEQLKTQRKNNMIQIQRLQICSEQLESLQLEIHKTENLKQDSLTELKPMKEKLHFKWNVVDCLEKLLVSTRLQTAEQEEIIYELKKQKDELEKDVSIMKNIKPSSVSTWQQEFLDAKLKEADVNLKFDKIRRQLAMLKVEAEESLEETNRRIEEEGSGELFSIKLSIKDKFQEQLKAHKDTSGSVTAELLNETERLKMQVNELHKIIEDIKKQISFNEDIKLHLYEVRSSIFQRLSRTNHELEKQIGKNKKLEVKMNEEIKRLQENTNEKDDAITNKMRKIEELQDFIQTSTQYQEESMSLTNEITLTSLEDQVEDLQENIRILKDQN